MIYENKKELKILLITDIHNDYNFLEKIKKWKIENKRIFDYIFCTGDILSLENPENINNETVTKNIKDLSNIIKFLENICKNVIYIGGNSDFMKMFKGNELLKLTEKSVNLHKNYFKITDDLYIFGVGGSIHALKGNFSPKDSNFVPFVVDSDNVLWNGFPYNVNEKSNYEKSDKIYLDDLNYTLNKLRNIIKENKTQNVDLILLTHIGPFYSNTTLMGDDNICVYSGSKNLQNFLKNNNDILINIHGHTHGGKGMVNFDNRSIINVGNVSEGNFGTINLEKDYNNKWFISKNEFIHLN
jgi:Icc-related predicted phosphoesterase